MCKITMEKKFFNVLVGGENLKKEKWNFWKIIN